MQNHAAWIFRLKQPDRQADTPHIPVQTYRLTSILNSVNYTTSDTKEP